MNFLDHLPNASNYQFARWSSSLSRPQSSLRSRDSINDMEKLNIDSRNELSRPSSSSFPSRQIPQHHIHIPTGSRLSSPPPPNTSPDPTTRTEHSAVRPMSSRRYRSIPVRIKPTSYSISVSKNKEELSSQRFPRQTHEQRKTTHERKHRKQQAQLLADKYAESDTWFQLRQSLSELKRLAIAQEILTNPSTSFIALGQTTHDDEENKGTIFNCESGVSSSFFPSNSTLEFNRTNFCSSQSSLSRPRPTKTYPRLVFEPLMAATKPIHPLLLTKNHIASRKSKLKLSSSSVHRSRSTTTPLTAEKRAHLLLSDLSNEENPPNSTSASPPMVRIEREFPSRKISTPSPTYFRAPSTIQMTSTIKLKLQTPRCHSATDINSSSSSLINKSSLRFILICDQEHRIESWYHQYPFIHSDDLLTSFESKSSSPQKSMISAFFIDDIQSSNPNITAKTFLQGKPFHINNDWKKYDLIFISNNIYEQIITYLQTTLNLIKSAGKLIKIFQINHDEDLQKQVKNICKQQQQNI